VVGRAGCRVAVASVDGVWAAGHVVDPRAQVTPQPAPVPRRRSRSTPTRSKTTSNARSGGRTHLPHRTGCASTERARHDRDQKPGAAHTGRGTPPDLGRGVWRPREDFV